MFHYAVLSSMCIAILFMFVGKNQVPIMECLQLYMSTENSVKRSLKTRSLWTKFSTRSITATGAVTI